MTRGGSTRPGLGRAVLKLNRRQVISLATAAILALTGLLVASPTPAGAAPAATAAQGRQLVPTADLTVTPSDYFINYHIRNVHSHLCMVARNGDGERPVVQTTCDRDVNEYWDDQYWKFTPTGDGTTHIESWLLGLCVGVRGSGEAAGVATTCDWLADASWDDQHWWVYENTDGTYQFQDAASGLCLAARGLTESSVIVSTCDWFVGAYWTDQHWSVF